MHVTSRNMKEELFHRLKDCILCCWQPVGVVGAITPWNFPLAMITRKVHGRPSNAIVYFFNMWWLLYLSSTCFGDKKPHLFDSFSLYQLAQIKFSMENGVCILIAGGTSVSCRMHNYSQACWADPINRSCSCRACTASWHPSCQYISNHVVNLHIKFVVISNVL